MLGKGLPNLGNTCYINSIIQCLRYSKPFVKSLVNLDVKKSAPLTKTLMQVLYSKTTLEQLRMFVGQLAAANKDFRLLRQCDAHELYLYVIDKFYEDVPKEYKNPFLGKLSSTLHFPCGHTSETAYPFISISVELCNRSIQQCVSSFFSAESLTNVSCDQCKKHYTADKQLACANFPLILVVHLKRFVSASSKKTDDVDLEDEIQIQGRKYFLYAVSNHIGQINSGHYTAHCKRRDGTFYLFNDSSVSSQDLPERSNLPYILFYQRHLVEI